MMPTIEYLNTRLLAQGYRRIKQKTFAKILEWFSDGRRFNYMQFYAFKDALELYGDTLFALELRCQSCGKFKPFIDFRFSKKAGQFYRCCRSPKCNVKDDNAFRKWKGRHPNDPETALTFERYQAEKSRHVTSNGRLNSFRSVAIEKRLQKFGALAKESSRICRICESRKKLMLFALYKEKDGSYSFKRLCLDCEAKGQRLRRKMRREQKNTTKQRSAHSRKTA